MTSNQVVTIQSDLFLPRQRKLLERAAKDLLSKILASGQEGGNSLARRIWPSTIRGAELDDPMLVVEPMERLGGEPGKTGNLVAAGQFFGSSTHNELLPSKPLIIKVSPEPEGDENQLKQVRYKRRLIADEWKAADYLRTEFSDSSYFAPPLELYEEGEDDPLVLWAPLTSDSPEYQPLVHLHQRRLSARIKEMYCYLSLGRLEASSDNREYKLKGISQALRSLMLAHCTPNPSHREHLSIVEHYSWELRDFDPYLKGEEVGRLTKHWLALWGVNPTVSDFGRDDWPNPISVLRKLSKMAPVSLRTGVVHGDMHPRNLVFAENESVRVIDFGWARPNTKGEPYQHINKDFVLMEANLRFMTLPPSLPYGDVETFCGWLDIDTNPDLVSNELMMRVGLIQQLREVCHEHNGPGCSWAAEYTIPLFLVSMGLLKYCHESECPWAFRRTVLELAENLTKELYIT